MGAVGRRHLRTRPLIRPLRGTQVDRGATDTVVAVCGLVATDDPDLIARAPGMLARIGHRGPDGTGALRCGPAWLGHVRLAIVDVEGGAQPLTDADGLTLVGNGEIYNHRALREELRSEDPAREFSSGSDNETALAAIGRWGADGVRRLEGMFALVLADGSGLRLAARDPMGIKPLYWCRSGGAVTFASELVAFEPGQRPSVQEFPPGHRWTPEGGLERFADAVPPTGEPFADRDAARRGVRAVLDVAVRRRLMADVEVGVLLSGGLDSSIVAALAVRAAAQQGRRVHSFAVGTAHSPDLAAARAVAAHLGTTHHERVYDADEAFAVLDEVVRTIEHVDPSLVRSAVANLLVARLAAQHVKVVLTGEGADELFAGYEHYRAVQPGRLQGVLDADVRGLHALNLQRTDRTSMACGLEARVPFLDLDVVALAARIPVAWRRPGAPGQEKQLLREAFADLLPPELLGRAKAQFGDASGAAEALGPAVAAAAAALAEAPAEGGQPAARSAEERYYQQVFDAHLPGVQRSAVLGLFATA